MKIVKIIGGLGNQMFQYAFYLALKKHHKDVKIDISAFKEYKLHNGFEISNIFDVNFEEANRKEIDLLAYNNNLYGRIKRKIFGDKKEIRLLNPLYYPWVLNLEGDVYYNGHWNSEKYFISIKEEIFEAFSFKKKLVDKNLELEKIIKSNNSISLHVRRGDYLENKINREIYGNICTKEYYEEAIDIIIKNIENPYFIVFSNDIEWCKENFKLDSCVFVDWNKGKDSYIDLQLMSLCKHNIIANSTFSWWGAWLNRNTSKIVISPSRFFNDVIPSDMESFLPKNWTKIKV